MKQHSITVPELALVAGTRGMLGAGIGLLVAGRMSRDHRRGAGIALLMAGIMTTIPLVIEIFRRED